ncbi:hypothetical protein BB560_002317 [Smittium megazygosporum]|uniref:RNB domain-containing protein n=1 Tax=Smittium megazygosporum TaxID=133381 RepID=A0A2T9ZFA3_9FUNG|nr:hypothetical protein BB560_002317 [Smittium megazygosporum]
MSSFNTMLFTDSQSLEHSNSQFGPKTLNNRKHSSTSWKFPRLKRFEYVLKNNLQYPPHVPPSIANTLVSKGIFIRAFLRTSDSLGHDSYATSEYSSPQNSYVSIPNLKVDSDIYICGTLARNRASNGDLVALKILSEEQKEKLHRSVHKNKRASNSRTRKPVSNIEESTDQSLAQYSNSNSGSDTPKALPYGKVVAILSKTPKNRMVIGKITKVSSDSNYFLLDCSSNSIDNFIIPSKELQAFMEKETILTSNIMSVHFVVSFKYWDQCHKYPTGQIVSVKDDSNFVDLYTQKILFNQSITHSEFSQNLLNSLPGKNWKIPHSEFKSRVDLTNQIVFTIDPPTSRDMDDAISVWKIDHSSMCVGVHIADVSYFVKHNSPLDKEARDRANTVYLVDRAIQMLPERLSSDLCSLVPGEDRLAVSVIWKFTKDFKILEKWIGRTVVHSTCKLSYADAQRVIEGGSLGHDTTGSHKIKFYTPSKKDTPGKIAKQVENGIRVLADFTKFLRNKRFDSGSLSLTKEKLVFQLDNDKVPEFISLYKQQMANQMIEELMLLANIEVASYLFIKVPNFALLRRHPAPLSDRLKRICEKLKVMGYTIDCTSSFTLQKSLSSVKNKTLRLLLEMSLIPSMKQAKYFCSGDFLDEFDKISHFALSVPIYTHFTSPIRRYPDVIVHRLLLSAIDQENGIYNDSLYRELYDKEEITSIALNSNIRKEKARIAGEKSALMFLNMYLEKNHTLEDPLRAEAHIVSLGSKKISIIVNEIGMELEFDVSKLKRRDEYIRDTSESSSIHLKSYAVGEDNSFIDLTWIRKDTVEGVNFDESQEDLLHQMSSLALAESGYENLGYGVLKESEICTRLSIFQKISVLIVPEMKEGTPGVSPIMLFESLI